jgi:SAM-dependent methyltransferase
MWGEVDAYEQFMGRYSARLAVEFARVAGVAAGQRVVEVGVGTGVLTETLARIVGGANVAGVDPTEPFVEHVQARVAGADVRIGTAEYLPFDVSSFDRALSQLVISFVGDPAAAAAELRRVLRPDGLAAVCTWDSTGGMTMFRTFWDALREVDSDATVPPPRFGGAPGQLAELLRDAGFAEVEEGELVVSASYGGFDDFRSALLVAPGPVGVLVGELDGDERDALLETIHRRLGSPEGPFELSAKARYALGVA